jgi:hypothetical protein
VLVAVVAVVAPIVADRRQADRLPSVSTPAEREPGQATLAVDPASGYVMTSQAKLRRAAAAVRVNPAADVTLPVSFGPLPDGLPVNHSRHRAGNGTLWVRVAGCTVSFSAWDPDQAAAADLRKIAAGARHADCTDPATWGPAVRW